MQMDEPDAKDMIRPSQGVHLVLDKSFLQSKHAIMIPHTSDGRVLFAVPWHNRVIVGTTDTLVDDASLEPRALEKEILGLVRQKNRVTANNWKDHCKMGKAPKPAAPKALQATGRMEAASKVP